MARRRARRRRRAAAARPPRKSRQKSAGPRSSAPAPGGRGRGRRRAVGRPRRARWTPFGAPVNVCAMEIKVGEPKAEARALARAGELGAALAAYDHLLAANPLDYDSRLKIADLLAAG